MYSHVSASSSFKRSRTTSSSNTLSSRSSSLSPEPTPKAARTALPPSSSSSSRELFCNLPPTCHPPENRPTYLVNSKELEAHYAKYHAHVCEADKCGAVFPDARLFELHQTECHDPLAALRRERGEKIFACHDATCSRRFQTPKTRRLHLIEAHGYPKEYFFGVTNKGIGGLLRRWGEGASMLRGTWKARDPDNIEADDENIQDEEEGSDDDGQGNDEDGDSAAMDITTENNSTSEVDVQDEVDGSSQEVQSTIAPRRNRRSRTRRTSGTANVGANENTQETSHTRPQPRQHRHTSSKGSSASASESVDALTTSLNSLSLLPSSVRFGRGAAHGGFSLAARGRGYGRGGPRGGRRGMYYGGIGAVRDGQAEEHGPKVMENGAGAGPAATQGEEDSRVMVPRVLTGKRGGGRGNRSRSRGGKSTGVE